MKRPSINMKSANLLLLAALWVSSSPLRAQNQNQPQPQQAKPQNPVVAQPATSDSNRLDDDPGFKLLPPEQQDWVRKQMDAVHTAIVKKDIPALEQVILDLTKHDILGMRLCGHMVDEGTSVDAVSANASSAQVIAIRWLDLNLNRVHSAIFTGAKRCVVTDGDTVDGKVIARALPNSLAISNQHALTAFEAEYWNSPAEKTGATHRGIFIENRFFHELDPHRASALNAPDVSDEARDFRWNHEEETINLTPGVLLAPTVAPPPIQPRPQTGCADANPKPQKPRIGFHLPPSVQRTIDKTTRKVAEKSGVELDPRAPADAIKDAQTTHPCPATPAKP